MGWRVAIGIDTHADVHVAVALDRLGGELGSMTIGADASGYLALWRWAQELGEPAFAIEGTGSYGAGLARFLVGAGGEVYECERPRRAERRRGKSDLIDAALAASRLLSGVALPRLRGGGVREALRLLLLERVCLILCVGVV
jgi:transposase